MRKYFPRWLRWLIAHHWTRKYGASYLPNIQYIGTGKVYTSAELRKELGLEDH